MLWWQPHLLPHCCILRQQPRPSRFRSGLGRANRQSLLGPTRPLSLLTNSSEAGGSDRRMFPTRPVPALSKGTLPCSSEGKLSLAAAERAVKWLKMMWTDAPQSARPLMELRSVWQSLLPMNTWMSRLISRGYTLQFASPPPPFLSVVEMIMLSQTRITALTVELVELLEKEAISHVPEGEENEGFISIIFSFQRKQEE